MASLAWQTCLPCKGWNDSAVFTRDVLLRIKRCSIDTLASTSPANQRFQRGLSRPACNTWKTLRPVSGQHEEQGCDSHSSERVKQTFLEARFHRRSGLLLPLPALLAATLLSADPARAVGDPTVTLEQVTPELAPARPLSRSETATVELFERSTYSVVNIFDVALRPGVNQTGSVEVPEGNGSGLVWDQEGHVVTNYHVVGSSLQQNPAKGKVVARVILLGTDGYQQSFLAELVGADKFNDLAVLKVNAPPSLLQALPLGSAQRLKVGQRVLAIGNPFGFDHTLTAGIVSGLNRDISSQTGVTIGGGIQTDAAINPGNSGGPLIDSQGRLVGINTAIYTRSGTSAGVGFAIPVDTVARVVPQLIAYGKVTRPGLNVQLASDTVAKQLNVKEGALVLAVPQGSAAARAGLLPTRRGLAGNITLGDVIVALGERQVKSSQDLGKVLDTLSVGDTVALKVLREGGKSPPTELSLVLEEDGRGRP
eukprot:TRINITY_DN9721_c0_g2_i1.p1 TRINITY_DN9721_c0_g2~~TRINITY_DN9721_c0_g2_i1.p1  ORF type:complete len:481 (-),score=55.33 TRINITY_DN9721_c0_g2_i1:410-1852(-)